MAKKKISGGWKAKRFIVISIEVAILVLALFITFGAWIGVIVYWKLYLGLEFSSVGLVMKNLATLILPPSVFFVLLEKLYLQRIKKIRWLRPLRSYGFLGKNLYKEKEVEKRVEEMAEQ